MRIKHVLNDGLYSVFATQEYAKFDASENYGYNASRNRSFDGNIVRSYSTIIAKRYTNSKGDAMVLMATNNYSMTTARHKHELKRACYRAGVKIFEVPAFYRDNDRSDDIVNLCYFWEKYFTFKGKAERAKKCRAKYYYQQIAIEFLENAVIYMRFFGVKTHFVPSKKLINSEKVILANYGAHNENS